MGDSPMVFEAILRPLAYFLLAVTVAYVWMWAAAIAAGAYLIGCIPGKPLWLPAKLALAIMAGVFAIFLAFGDHGHHLIYAGYWAALFCLLGDTYPITAHFKRNAPFLPAGLAQAGAILPIVGALLYQDFLVLLLSILLSGLIVLRTKGKLL